MRGPGPPAGASPLPGCRLLAPEALLVLLRGHNSLEGVLRGGWGRSVEGEGSQGKLSGEKQSHRFSSALDGLDVDRQANT